MNRHAPLPLQFTRLTVVVDSVEELAAGWQRSRNLSKLSLNILPDRHRVEAGELASDARHEELATVLVLDESPEDGRDLQSSLFVDLRGEVSPEHPYTPSKSNKIHSMVEGVEASVNNQ